MTSPDEAGGDRLDELEVALGHVFRDRTLLETAVTHSSFANESASDTDNERLEFLGDSVIGMVAAQLLYRAHPDWPEGDLTRGLHQLVDRRGLAALARRLDLGSHIRLGRTELRSRGGEKDTILADAMEAVLGAMYLDGGIETVEHFGEKHFAEALAAEAPRVGLDPKTGFQEWVMAEFGVFPTYRTIRDSGIEGDEQRFTVELLIRGEPVARGTARSKRRAQRRAASTAHEDRDRLLETFPTAADV